MAPSFDTLQSATLPGLVIILTHSKSCLDILVLLHNASSSLIQTSKGFYNDANRLRDDLLGTQKTRKWGPRSIEYDHTLASILKGLYNLVCRPMIDRLHKLDIEEQLQVRWCPASIFCSLPLHAMGPIPSNYGVK
jgi:hypothetical protein